MKTIRELDGAGIRYLWSKIKAFVSNAISGKVDKVSSSTDNAVVRFDGTSGDIQNSGVTINDSNHLTAAKLITSGGTSSQFVKGDGSLDSNSYATESYVQDEIDTLTDGTAASESGNIIDVGEYDLMKIDEVKGKSLVMNQLVSTSRFYTKQLDNNEGTFTNNGDGTYTITTTGTTTNTLIDGSSVVVVVGHKILIKRTGDVSQYITMRVNGNENKTGDTIFTATGISVYPRIASGLASGTYTIRFIVIDLTQMFGAGNEPTTVEEVEAILGNDYYEYNTGEVVGNSVEKLDVYDSNDTKKGSLALNLSELTGKVNGEGTSVTIFSGGLHGVGTAYDSLIVDEDGYARRAIKRMGSVDLGSLSWTYNSSATPYFATPRAVLSMNSHEQACISAQYSYVSGFWEASGNDMCYCAGANNFNIANSSYTTAVDFKAAMDGVMFYYKLATPIEYVLDTPVQCVTKVYPNGTVKQVPVMPDSTPMVMDVTYLHDTGGVIGGLIGNYATKKYVDDIVGDIETLLASI